MYLEVIVPCDTHDILYQGKNLLRAEKNRIDARVSRNIMAISPSLWRAGDRFFSAEIDSLFPSLTNPEMTLIWTIKFFVRSVFINNYQEDIRILEVVVPDSMGYVIVKIGDKPPQQKGIRRDASDCTI